MKNIEELDCLKFETMPLIDVLRGPSERLKFTSPLSLPQPFPRKGLPHGKYWVVRRRFVLISLSNVVESRKTIRSLALGGPKVYITYVSSPPCPQPVLIELSGVSHLKIIGRSESILNFS